MNLRSSGITLSIITSAFAVAVASILPAISMYVPFSIIASAAHVADTLFHELGHTVFNWLFGRPAIPMIFTLFGADQAGGLSLAWERSWFVQGMAFAMLLVACHWVKRYYPRRFIPAVLFSLLLAGLAFTQWPTIIILYMGHGSAIAVGGWLLYRGCMYIDSRNQFERWLNAFLGFFLILNNLYFAYMLAFDLYARREYMEHTPFGISHDDFTAITEEISRWSVKGVAVFTIGYCCIVIAAAFLLALLKSLQQVEEED